MKILLVLCVGLCAVYANPIPEPQAIDMLRIPFGHGDKELDILTLADQDGKINERNKRTIGMLRELFPALSQVAGEDGDMDPNAFNEELTRVIRDLASQQQTNAIEETKDDASSQQGTSGVASSSSDQQVAETQSAAQSQSSSALDELSLDDNEESIDDENRNKRFLNFGFGASTGGAAAGGGSGNFLFDIIRRTADRAARAAGTVYRIVAGTEPLGGITESKLIGSKIASLNSNRAVEDSTNDTTNDGLNPVLVGGGSGTEQTDEQANAPDTVGVTKTDGYTEGIPGPVTRLFVLANRGLSNLIQDLILRVAQTSERVVNFKARLITSLI